MTFFKSVSVLLMAAIASPMCCCLGGSSSVTEVPVEHACCQPSQDEDREQQSLSDCPHTWEKDSQISQSGELGDSLSKPIATLACTLPTFATPREIDRLGDKRHSLRKTSIPTPSLAQSYCVYLL